MTEVSFQKNDLVEIEISDMGNDGEGIGKKDGYPFFVKDAMIGDTVRARVTKVKKGYSYARLEELKKPSPYRIEPVCANSRPCGGCQIQAMEYAEQLRFKQQKVRGNLIRIGGFEPELIDRISEPIVGMEHPFRYRNKAQYPVAADRDGNPITGFYAGRTHSIIAGTECYLGAEENRVILETILQYMRRHHVAAYDEEAYHGLVRHILIRKGFTSGELMVCLVINKDMTRLSSFEKEALTKHPSSFAFLPEQGELLAALSQIQGMTSVSVSINTERTNVIMGTEIYTIWGEDTITDTIHVRDMERDGFPCTGEGLTFRISPLSFYQVNPIQTEKLYSLALAYAGLTGTETVWDLYCGIGTISLFLAGKAKRVCGVEIIPQAIEDARKNARCNGIENATFYVGKAEEVLPAFYEKEGKGCADLLHPDVIVVDPPRKGCDNVCLETILRMQPDRIVYVSCDSATLARDLKILCGGYELKKIRPVDQFPMTVHVETVVLMSRKDV